MSRLYNALEKIRTGEAGAFSPKKPAPAKGLAPDAGKNRKRWLVLLGASAALSLALLLFFAGSQRKEAAPPRPSEAVATDAAAPARQPAQPAPATTASPRLSPAPPGAPPLPFAAAPAGTGNEPYRQLNDAGVALIQENQHWRAIYHLEQARTRQPERPEALINMAVALAELGLRAPAKRLFREAHALAPNHPLLRKNLDLLEQAEFFDGQWLADLTAGQTRPGQATQPQ